MHYLVRFWIVVLSLMTGISALGFLTLSFVFSDAPLFAVSTVERLLVVLVGVVSIGVVIWGSTTFGDETGTKPEQ
jgi:hypothetical protein